MNTEQAAAIIQETKRTYDAIAHHFSQTRYTAGPWLASLTKNVSSDAKVLDIGCGNGRLREVLPQDVSYTGIDISENLLSHAREKYPKATFMVFDGTTLPFDDGAFSYVYMLAAFHHIPTPLQLAFLKECHRVLRHDGKLIVTAWHLWRQPFLGYLFSSLPEKLISRKLELRDIYVPWKHKERELGKRYFHMLTKRELEYLARQAGFQAVTCEVQPLGNQKNYLLRGRK